MNYVNYAGFVIKKEDTPVITTYKEWIRFLNKNGRKDFSQELNPRNWPRTSELEFGEDQIVLTRADPYGEVNRKVLFGKIKYKKSGELITIKVKKEYFMMTLDGVLTGEVYKYLPSSPKIVWNTIDLIDYNTKNADSQILTDSFDDIGDGIYENGKGKKAFSDPKIKNYFIEGWHLEPFSSNMISNNEEQKTIFAPAQFKKQFADRIINFNTSKDTIEINLDSFKLDNSATFASGKNKKEVKGKLARQEFDFLYEQSTGKLYFNENGSDEGFGDGGIVAIIKSAANLNASNLEFV